MKEHLTISIGIDWADREHDVHLVDHDRRPHAAKLLQTPEGIRETIKRWRKQFPNATFEVAIESSKGALVNALQQYDDMQIFPVNPAALASYRKAFAHGGGKNDPTDAMLLCQYLQHYRSQCNPSHATVR